MNDAEYTVFEKSTKAIIRRISAENTWLRHTMMEMESHIADMKAQLSAVETRVKTLRKELSVTKSAPRPKKTADKTTTQFRRKK